MHLYLDNNILVHADDALENERLRRWMQEGRHKIVRSEPLLTEVLAIPDEAMRRRRMAALGRLPGARSRPVAALLVREFIPVVAQQRKEWLRRPVGDDRIARAAVAKHLATWRDLRRAPRRVERDHTQFRELEPSASARSRSAQRTLKSIVRESAGDWIEAPLGDEVVRMPAALLHSDEGFFRVESLVTWWAALREDQATLRDLYLHAIPYLRPARMTATTFVRLWLEDVRPAAMPRGFLTSVVVRAQLDTKIGHGNVADVGHATYLKDADVFFTEDREFARALERACRTVGVEADIALLRRAETSVVDQLDAYLN